MAPIPAIYDYRLVAVSIVLAVFASYAALDLAGRVTASSGRTRLAWLAGGAFAMGSGIWAMHYVGMLAFRLPIPVYYHLPTVALSFVAAILAALIALHLVSLEHLTPRHLAVGSVVMGSGIATMHYTGMAAMRLAAMHEYDRGLWVVSILLAIVISFAGLLLISYFREENRSWISKLATAVIIGLAIPVMHYTGMAATHFTATDIAPDLAHSVDISALANSGIIAVIFLILTFEVIAALVDRRLAVQRAILDDERTMLRALIDNIPDFMYVKDRQSRFVIANAHAAKVLGANSVEEVLGKTDFDFFSKEIAVAFYGDEQGVMRSGEPMYNREEKGIDGKGSEIHILTTKVPLRDSKGRITGIAGVGRDISARKKSEDALREAERNYRGIFHDAPVGMFQSNPQGRFLNVNPAMARIFGYESPAEMIASVTDISAQHVNPKRYHEFVSVMAVAGSMLSLECEVYRKDRSKIWISASGRAVRQGNIAVRFEGMVEDITEGKQMRNQLLQAQKLESVGQLAAGIAHEINTPTQYIGDNVRFLKDSIQDIMTLLTSYEGLLKAAKDNALSPETIQEVIDAAQRADVAYLLEEIPKAIDQTLEGVTRVSTLVSAMKEFSHPGTKEKTPLDINRAIESTITVARSEWKYSADMETDFDRSMPLVSCQPGEFNQVILNLIVNAAHAIADVAAKGGAEKGKITVRTQNFEDWAEIRVHDTGTGIPEKVLARIFDPFFTTKEIGKGTGQGLAIARSVVVDKHGGTIDCETEEGKGTTFIIRLPHDGKTVSAKAVSA